MTVSDCTELCFEGSRHFQASLVPVYDILYDDNTAFYLSLVVLENSEG